MTTIDLLITEICNKLSAVDSRIADYQNDAAGFTERNKNQIADVANAMIDSKIFELASIKVHTVRGKHLPCDFPGYLLTHIT